MMDGNSSKPDADDWRAQLEPEFRERVVNKVLEKLNKEVPFTDSDTIHQLIDVAMKFELRIYNNSMTKDDYMHEICKKMTSIGNSYHHSIAASSSDSGLTPTTMVDAVGHSSSLQNMPGISHDRICNSVGQGMQSNIFASTQRDMPERQPSQQVVFQPHQHQPLRHQRLEQKVQQPNTHPSLMQPNIHYGHHHQRQQQILSQPTQLQSSQQSILPTLQHQQLMGQQSNATILQHNQQLGQKSNLNVSEQQQRLSQYQPNMSNSFRQPLRPQSNVSGLQQQQQMLGRQSNFLNMQPHQHSVHILQQTEATAAQQKVQQTSHPVQLHQLLGLQKQSNSLQEGTKERLQTSAALLQPQTVIDQQKQLSESQRVLPEASPASVESRAQAEHENVGDWYDQAYHKIQSMKEMYLSDLIKLYKRAHVISLQAAEPEQVEKQKNNKIVIEKMIKFLQIPRNDINHCSKDKLVYYMQVISRHFSLPRNKNSVSIQQHGQQLQPPGGQSEIPQLQQQRNSKLHFHPGSFAVTSTPVGSNPQLLTQQGIPMSQPNMINSLQSGSTMGFEQRNASSPLKHGSTRFIHQNIVSAPQQTNSSHNTSGNASDPTMDSLQLSSTIPFQHRKQQQKNQMMQTQKPTQQMPQQMVQQKKHQMLMQKIHEVNDPRMRQLMGVSSGMLQQPPSVGQRSEYPHQSLLPTTLCQLHATSPQISQNSSPLIDQQNLLSPLSKAGTPLHSANSPFIVASPSTPLTPSSIPVDLEKLPSGLSPLSGHPQTPVAPAQVQTQSQIQNHSLAMGIPGISASPLLTDVTTPDGNQQSCVTEQPFERLLKAVKSISPMALSASVCDIGSAVNITDNIAGTTAINESMDAIGEDLVANIRCHLQESEFSLQYECASARRMKRHISAIALDTSSSSVSEIDTSKQFSGRISDSESTATSGIKRRRIEPNNALLEEIRDINQRLVETVIDVVLDSTEDAATTAAGEGTIIKCSYSAVALSESFKLQQDTSQKLPILPLRLLVPANYPKTSPIILDRLPIGLSKESDDLSEKAKSRFSISLRNLEQPMSLREMARTWDICARAVSSEFAQRMGGESFSSRYGTWENCVTAS